MTIEEIFAYFVEYISAPLILAIGLIGNTLGLIAFFNKKLANVGPCIIYRSLFFTDSFYLVQIIVYYLQYPFFIDLTMISSFSCKIFYYLNYLACLPSPWFLVYISIEKCISIVYPTKRLILKKQLYQYIYIISVYIFSIINWMYSISSVYLPFIAMILISVMLAFFLTMISFQQGADPEIIPEKLKKRLARDRIYTKSSFFMNLVFILLNLPISILYFYPGVLLNSYLNVFILHLQILSYGISFYIIIIMNTKFRASLWKILRKKKPKQ